MRRDLLCAPQCTPCASDCESDVLPGCIMDELETIHRLRVEDPAAYEAMLLARLPTSKCCLCGESFKGFGHNASPVCEEGVACDTCNGAIVLPQRFRK